MRFFEDILFCSFDFKPSNVFKTKMSYQFFPVLHQLISENLICNTVLESQPIQTHTIYYYFPLIN